MVEALKTQQAESPVTEADLVDWIWQGLMRSLDLSSGRADQNDGQVVQHVTVSLPLSVQTKS